MSIYLKYGIILASKTGKDKDMKAKKIIKEALIILVLLAILVSTFVPIILKWDGLWNRDAGLEALEATRVAASILYSEQKGIDQMYRDKLIKMLKE